MLALDVNLEQSWCGEELFTLVTLMELQICEGEDKRVAMPQLEGPGPGAGAGLGRGQSLFHRASAELGACVTFW